MDATSDRDFVLEYLQALTFVGLHLSRFAEEITLFATAEFGFVNLPEAFSTGSSAMPQKKNPDLTELIRAKVGRIHGAAQAVTLQLKGLPLAYNKDMQETQEPAFAVEFVAPMLTLVARFTAALELQSRTHERGGAVGLSECDGRGDLPRAQGRSLPHGAREDRQRGSLCSGKGRRAGRAEPRGTARSLGRSSARTSIAAVTLTATLDCHDVIGGTARGRVQTALDDAAERIAALTTQQSGRLSMLVRKALLQDASNVYDLVNSLSGDGTLLKRVVCGDLRKHSRLHGGGIRRRRVSGLRRAALLRAASLRSAFDRGEAGGEGPGRRRTDSERA